MLSFKHIFFLSSCWLSLEGGLLYAFVGPAAVIVLVSLPLKTCCLGGHRAGLCHLSLGG